jgi:hypothetical protein
MRDDEDLNQGINGMNGWLAGLLEMIMGET